MISIHSLVKRETSSATAPKSDDDFNPLPRKEGDSDNGGCLSGCGYFNPLPRKEGDETMAIPRMITIKISIHSLVKRETKSPAFAITL